MEASSEEQMDIQVLIRIVYNRSGTLLVKKIRQNVRPGTRIITDGWAAYRNLASYGYVHDVVIHERTSFQRMTNLSIPRKLNPLGALSNASFDSMEHTKAISMQNTYVSMFLDENSLMFSQDSFL